MVLNRGISSLILFVSYIDKLLLRSDSLDMAVILVMILWDISALWMMLYCSPQE